MTKRGDTINKLNISLSHVFHNKKPINGLSKTQAFGTPTPAALVTPQELFKHITSGKTFVVGTYAGDAKSKANFIQSQTLWLDLDDNTSIADCLEVPFIRDNAFMLYSSGTSSHEYYKTRVGFQLDEPITDSRQYERVVLALFEACKPLISDDACKDSSRLFYGSTNTTEPPILNPDRITRLAPLEAIADDLDIISLERTEEMNTLIRASNKERMSSNSTALEAYANKALDNMMSELSSMSEGGRNNTAFKFGASMGNMASAGMIDAVTAETTLIQAALASGLSQFESLAVSRGMQRGMQTPFDTSKLSQKSDNKYWLDRDTYKEYIDTLPTEEPIEYKLSDSELLPGGYGDVELLPYAYLRWTDNQYLPLSWIRALLTLSNSQSAVTTIAIKLHNALRTGKINGYSFTIADVLRVLDTPRKSTTAAFDTLFEWGFVSGNESYSIYKELSHYGVQNKKGGRPAKTYCVVTDTEMINLNLVEMLDHFVIERHTKKSVAPREYTMIQNLDLSSADASQWYERAKSQLDNEVKNKIERDRNDWRKKLISKSWDAYIKYDIDCDNVNLRVRILSNYIAKYDIKKTGEKGIQMSQDEIMTLIGLKSVNSFKNIYNIAKIKPQKMVEWAVIANPNGCDLQQEIINAGKPTKDRRGGVVIALNLKRYGGKWLKYLSYGDKMFETYKSHDGMIDDMQVRVQLPCLIRFKTEQELEDDEKAARQKAVEDAQEQESEATDTTQADTQETPKIADKPRPKTRYSGKRDRSWDKHDKQWLYTQLQAEMYCWLNQELKESGHVFGKDGSADIRLSGTSDIIRYINEQIILRDIDKPFHTAEKFFDSDVLDFGVDTQKEKEPVEPVEVELEPVMIEPIVKSKKQRLTLAESRAWGNSEDKIGYLESIGVK